MFTHIDGIAGTQYLHGAVGYDEVRKQYATSSHGQGVSMTPGLIVKAHSVDDVVHTLKYAKSHNSAVATRTGGFMHWGLSSTTPNNIQLDLSSSFTDRSITQTKEGKTLARIGVSNTIGEVNAYLGGEGLFVPHGTNSLIGLGGHVQTGGYGQLARSFGLMGDYVASFEMINHTGVVEKVTQASNSDLFFAVLGGSPGNMGILTHVTFEVLRDDDYTGSAGLKVSYPYSSATLQRLLEISTEMSDNVDLARNYDLAINVTESELVVYASFIAINETDEPNLAWFDALNSVATSSDTTGVQFKPVSELTSWFLSSESGATPQLPYQSSLSLTESVNLQDKQWPTFVAQRFDSAMAMGLKLGGRFQPLGGEASQLTANANNGTAYSWRDSTMLAFVHSFYSPEQKTVAVDWQRAFLQHSIGPNGVFAEERRCLLWGPAENSNLDHTWSYYYEDREKYERLQKVRAVADPNGTFTANLFSVKPAYTDGGVVVPETLTTGMTSFSKLVPAQSKAVASH